MNLPLYIAKRYLFSKKSHNVINIISAISILGVSIGSLALIVVLSAFNGLEDLVGSLYNSFDSDIRITIKEGKTFDLNSFPEDKIRKLEGVVHYTDVLEETVLLKYQDKQSIAVVKGVESDFLLMSGLDSMIIDGDLVLKEDSFYYAVMGYGIAINLTVSIGNFFDPISMYAARRKIKVSPTNPEQAFRKMPIMPAGIFAINPDFDDKYIIVPFEFASELLEYDQRATAVELGLKPEADEYRIKEQLQQLLGEDYQVKTQYEQNELIFKTNQTEKWVTYLILSFILVIATFNVIGSLTMLIIDKKDDILILKSMGATKKLIRRIFLLEGLLINLVGGMSGLVLGGLLCFGQQKLGFVRLEGVLVDYYPVSMEPMDFVAVMLTVMVIGFAASWFPVRFVTRRHF